MRKQRLRPGSDPSFFKSINLRKADSPAAWDSNYKRLIDDAIYCLSRQHARQFQQLLASFQANIQLDQNEVYETKAMLLNLESIFQYVPPSSAHPPCMFKSFVQGELQRISELRRKGFSSLKDFPKEVTQDTGLTLSFASTP